MEVIAGHKANSALKAQNADVSPGDIAVFTIEIANRDLRRPFGQVDLFNSAGPTF